MSVLGRNDLCPCGSGRKVKKCHAQLAGTDPARALAGARVRARAQAWADEHLAFFRSCDGYVPPAEEGTDGWSREAWRAYGCPFMHDAGEGPICNKGTQDQGRCASPSCGV